MTGKAAGHTNKSSARNSAGPLGSSLTWAEWRQVAAIAYTQFTMGMQMTLPFTIAVYMVRGFESESISEARVSRLTGILAAVASTAQCITALPWGFISDRIGRRPVVVVGNVVCMLSMVAFGAARSYEQAVAARFVGGFFNGITGSLKTIIGESFNSDGQARALSALSCAWGLGTVFGSAIGGVLADPCNMWGGWVPGCGAGGLLQGRPYLLPCAAVGALSCFASIISLTVTPGPRVVLPAGRSSVAGIAATMASAAQYSQLADEEREEAAEGVDSRNLRVAIHVQEPGADTELVPVSWTEKQRHGSDRGTGAGSSPRHTQAEAGGSDAAASNSIPGAASQEGLMVYAVDAADDVASDTDVQPSPNSESPGGDRRPLRRSRDPGSVGDGSGSAGGKQQRAWYRCRQVQLTIVGYGSVALFNTFTNELIPLFASTPAEHGGLSLTTSQLAGPLAFAGAVFLLYAAFVYPMFQRAVGTIASCLWGLALSAPSIAAIPLSSLPRGNFIASQAILYLSLAARQSASMNAFTSSIVMVNQASPKGQLGAVNGAAMMLASAVRAAGPALCGLVWAETLGLRMAGHQYLPFCLAALGNCGIFLLYYLQRHHLPRPEN